MACKEFEDRLIDYADLTTSEREAVDVHLAACESCRGYLETVLALDWALARHYSAVEAPAALEARVFGRLDYPAESSRLTMVPEVLDFAGWASVIAVIATLALVLPLPAVPLLQSDLFAYSVLAAAAAAVAGAVWAASRSFAEMKN